MEANLKLLAKCNQKFVEVNFYVGTDGTQLCQSAVPKINTELVCKTHKKERWWPSQQARTKSCSLTHLPDDSIEPPHQHLYTILVASVPRIKGQKARQQLTTIIFFKVNITALEENSTIIKYGLLNIRSLLCGSFLIYNLKSDHHIDLFLLPDFSRGSTIE